FLKIMFRHTLSTPVLPPVPVYRSCVYGFHGTIHSFHGSGMYYLLLLHHGTACGGICRTEWIYRGSFFEIRTPFPIIIHRILTTLSDTCFSFIIRMSTRLRPARIKQILAPHNPCHIRAPIFRLSIRRIMPDTFRNFIFLAVKINCHRGYSRISYIISAFYSICNMSYINTHFFNPPFPETHIHSLHYLQTVSVLALPRGLCRPHTRQCQMWPKSVQQDDRHANRT